MSMDTDTFENTTGMSDRELMMVLYAYSRGVQDARGGSVPGLSELFAVWALVNRYEDEGPDMTWDRFLDTPEATLIIASANGVL